MVGYSQTTGGGVVVERVCVERRPDLADQQATAGDPDVDDGFHLEAVAPLGSDQSGRWQVQGGQRVPPECVVAVTQIGERGLEDPVHQPVETPVAQSAELGDVVTTPAVGESAALGQIRARRQSPDERGDLGRIGGTVGVDHHQDVADGLLEPACQRVALARSTLPQHRGVWPQAPGHRDRIVHRTAVDHDDLVDGRHALGDVWQVERFVEGRDDHRDGRPAGTAGEFGRSVGHERISPVRYVVSKLHAKTRGSPIRGQFSHGDQSPSH